MFTKILLVCVVVIFGYSEANKPYVSFPEEQTAKLKEAATSCSAKYNLDLNTVVQEIREKKYKITREFQEMIYCIYNTVGFLKDDGSHVDVDKINSYFPKDVNVRNEMELCSKQEGKDKVEAIFNYFKCFQEKSSVIVKIF